MKTHQVIAAAVVLSIVASTAGATPQDRQPIAVAYPKGASAEATNVLLIDELAFSGLRHIAPGAVIEHVASRAGGQLDSAEIDHDVRSLAQLGWFETIRVEVAGPPIVADALQDGPRRVRLTFSVKEYPFLTKVEYTGSGQLTQQQIDKLLAEKKLTPKLGEPNNPVNLWRIASAIQFALADLGYPYARAQLQEQRSSNATTSVRFKISDGPHIPVGRVTFEGHPEVSARLLRRQMRSITPGALFANLRGRDAFSREAFEEDRERLLAYYQNHGFPEARIGAARVSRFEETFHPWWQWPHRAGRARLTVAIPIEVGHLYNFESVTTSDTLAQTAKSLGNAEVALPDLKPGRPYSARAVEHARRIWQARVQPKPRHGDATPFRNVEAIRSIDTVSHTARVRFDLSPTPPYVVRRLEFLGNHRFLDRYFRSRIALKEGAPMDDRVLEAGLARLARTGYFKPIKKEDIHVETHEASRTAYVTIRVEEIGQQRISLVGGRGQFGSTLGVAYTVFNLLDREEVLSSHIEGGPESLQLAIGLAKEGFLGSRGSLALSVFDLFLRPHLTGGVQGPFFKQESEGISAPWNYALTSADTVTVRYDLSHSKTEYSPTLPDGITGLTASDIRSDTSSHAAGLGWAHDTGDQRILVADSVSGAWLGGSENMLRSKAEFGRVFHDPIFNRQNAWAFRTNFTGAGSYSGDMPVYARLFSGDEFVRGLRDGELGPDAVVSSTSSSGTTKYSAYPTGANLIGAANAEYRVPLAGGTEAAGFFDLGSGLLLPNWLGQEHPTLIDSTNGILHGSTGIQLTWTLPGIGVPIRAYYALNVLRLDRSFLMPDGSLFRLHNRLSGFGWGLGALF